MTEYQNGIFKITISETQFKEDFTVIYKGLKEPNNNIEKIIEKIKTSRDEFIRKLRYFKNKIYELEQINEIFIQDIYPVAIFREFINSLKTNKVSITEQNCSLFCQLCSKYQYEELQKEIENFSKQKPYVYETIDYLINQSSLKSAIDAKKEEKISQHLDIFLQNDKIINIPLPILIRILNSPTRVLNDHQLLVKFVHKVIHHYSNDENSVDFFQPLLNSLDYMQMSNDELDELFNNEHFKHLQNSNHLSDRMLLMIEERKVFEQRFKALEKKYEEILKKIETENQVLKQQCIEIQKQHEEDRSNFENILIQHEQMYKKLQEDQQTNYTKMIEELQKQKEMQIETDRKLDAFVKHYNEKTVSALNRLDQEPKYILILMIVFEELHLRKDLV